MSRRMTAYRQRLIDNFNHKLVKKEKETGEYGHLELLTQYVGERKYIKMKCLDCGLVFKIKPIGLFHRKKICPNKSRKSRKLHRHWPYTFSQVKAKVNRKFHGHMKILTKHYQKLTQRLYVEHYDKSCPYYKKYHKFYKFYITGSQLFKCKIGCPIEAKIVNDKSITRSAQSVAKEISDTTHGTYKLVGGYTNMTSDADIMHYSKKCAYYQRYHKYYVFHMSPDSFLSKGERCLYDVKMAGEYHVLRTQAEFEHEVDVVGHGHYRVKSKYRGSGHKVLIEHHDKHCTYYKRYRKYYQWWILPGNFVNNGRRCPYNRMTHGENDTDYWLDYYRCLFNDKKYYIYAYVFSKHPNTKFGLHLDFYLPNIRYSKYYYNGVGIEFDGQQHFAPEDFSYSDKEPFIFQFFDYCWQQYKDYLKDEHCKKYHIKLIRIKNIHGLRRQHLQKLVNHVLNKKLLPTLLKLSRKTK